MIYEWAIVRDHSSWSGLWPPRITAVEHVAELFSHSYDWGGGEAPENTIVTILARGFKTEDEAHAALDAMWTPADTALGRQRTNDFVRLMLEDLAREVRSA